MIFKLVETSGLYKVIESYGHNYVMRELDRNKKKGFPNPNFMGSMMALRGILKPDETINQFIKRDGLKQLRPMNKDN